MQKYNSFITCKLPDFKKLVLIKYQNSNSLWTCFVQFSVKFLYMEGLTLAKIVSMGWEVPKD